MILESVTLCPSCEAETSTEVGRHQDFGLRRCQRCHFLYVSPRPTQEYLSQLYEEEYFTGSGPAGNPEGYLSQSAGYRARASVMVDWIRKLSSQSGRWLDIGCGPGFIVEAAQQSGFQAVGVDVSNTAVAFGTQQLGLDLRVSNAEELTSVVQGPFHVISLFDCLFHVRQPRLILKQIVDLLAPGGMVFAGPFDLHSPDWVPSPVVTNLDSLGIPEHVSFVNQHSMQFLMSDLGFADIRFVAMPESPSSVAEKKLSMLPPWLLQALRRIVRRTSFLQKGLHHVASQVKNAKAGYAVGFKAT